MPRRLLLACILAVSAAAHLKGIAAPVLDYHYHRQTNTAAIARNFHRRALPPWSPRVDWEGGRDELAGTELPLYMWLVGLLWPVLGLGERWGRLLSAACSALTAVVLFAFLERRPGAGPGAPETGWLETPPAFLAALFFSVLPVEVYFGRTVQPEALALLGTVAALWAFDRYLAAGGPVRWAWWAATVLSAAVAIGLKLPYLYLIGVLGVLALARRGKAALGSLPIWLVPAGTLALVWAWYAHAATGTYVVPTSSSTHVYKTFFQLDRYPYFVFFQLFSRLPELALTYPGVLFFVAGARELAARRAWFLGGWWLCVLVTLIAGGAYTHHHEYTALPWAPVNAAFIGTGFWTLWRAAASGGRAWAKPALAVLALGMPVHAALRIPHWYRLNFPYLLSLKPVVDRVSRPEDLFVCNERASSLILYFIDRRGWSWDLAENAPSAPGRVEALAAEGARFFLTPRAGAFASASDPLAAELLDRYPVVHQDADVLILDLRGARR
ncbi:MAG: glycosyltransferase family 39 protein [Elusimicrobia bacterium]|nr:glycosyltransferase family 39 protein [Elusimicrobiota bacterium]